MLLRAIIVGLMLSVFSGSSTALAFEPDEAVFATWARTDLPVAEGEVSRTWMWGPEAITEAMAEPYAEAPAQLRPVQYFDKSRMEITDPGGDPDSPWYVTNGLLVVEMVTGQVQVGDAEFEERIPAKVNIVGDPGEWLSYDDIDAFRLRDLPAREEGALIGEWFGEAGISPIGPNNFPEFVYATERVTVPGIGHTIASVFWEFMTRTGTVYENGQYLTANLFENPFFATGYPITEAYWSIVKVGGTAKPVLWQCFERRCLTYTPDNPDGWQIEAGNVGRHYYEWRYGDMNPDPPTAPDPPDGTVTIDIEGIEIDAGETTGDVTYGATFIGSASGGLEGAMEVAIDYTPPFPGPNVTNTIVGGTWSVTSSSSSLAGTVESGTAIWDAGVDEAAVSATFVITTATGEFEGLVGTGAFSGTLSHRTFPPRITGTLIFQVEEE